MDLLVPALFAIFVWWSSTGALLYLDGRSSNTFAATMTVATLALGLSVFGIAQLSHTTTQSAAYWSFVCGLACWGWQEMTLYLGYITGPRRTPLTPGTTGWPRFVMASQAILYHEVAIALLGVALLWLTWDAPNQIGTWTYRDPLADASQRQVQHLFRCTEPQR